MGYRPPSSGGSYIASALILCAGVTLCLLIVMFFSTNPNEEIPVAMVVIVAVVLGAVAVGASSVELPTLDLSLPWRRKRKMIRYELRRKKSAPPPVPASKEDPFGESTWVPAKKR